MNDLNAKVDDIKHELSPIIDLLEYHSEPFKIGLKSTITFKDFKLQFPTVTKKQLIGLFGWFEDNKTETKQAIKELQEVDQ